MVVNGKTWPNFNVEPRRYRFRFLNGCNARFLILKLVTDPLNGGKDGKVTIDRSALDEILAEIAQIKAILRRNGG